jgi:hypothetical protein
MEPRFRGQKDFDFSLVFPALACSSDFESLLLLTVQQRFGRITKYEYYCKLFLEKYKVNNSKIPGIAKSDDFKFAI